MTYGAILASLLAALAADEGRAAAERPSIEGATPTPTPTSTPTSTSTSTSTPTSTSTSTSTSTATVPAADHAAGERDRELTARPDLPSPRDSGERGGGEGQASAGPAPAEWQPPPALEEAARIALRASEAGIPIVYFGEPIVHGPEAPVDSASPEPGAALEVLPAGPAPSAEPLEPAPEGVPLSDAGPILLRRTERPDGTALERVIEPDGEIVEHEVSPAGTVLSCRRVGSLLALRLVAQRPAAGGEFLQLARDEESGALVRYAVARDGEPRAVALVGAN